MIDYSNINHFNQTNITNSPMNRNSLHQTPFVQSENFLEEKWAADLLLSLFLKIFGNLFIKHGKLSSLSFYILISIILLLKYYVWYFLFYQSFCKRCFLESISNLTLKNLHLWYWFLASFQNELFPSREQLRNPISPTKAQPQTRFGA